MIDAEATIAAPVMPDVDTFLPIHRQTRLDPSDRFALGHS
jgi:hypothetical protein